MKDMMSIIYDGLMSNEYIATNVTCDGIKYFQLPETFDTSKPFIILDTPFGPSLPKVYGSNEELVQVFSCQLNVESHDRLLTKRIAVEAKKAMWNIGFGQNTLGYTGSQDGLDTYFETTQRFVDVRRYRKNTDLYDVDY